MAGQVEKTFHYWKVSTITYKDEIVIYRVISSSEKSSRDFLVDLKKRLKRDFAQADMLIVERNIETL